MSTQTNVENTPIEQLKETRNTFLKLLACMAAGIIILIISNILDSANSPIWELVLVLGLAVFAAPLVLSLGLGLPIIDIGPVFKMVNTPIGNVIYRTAVPDIAGRAATNLFLTIIRAFLILLISVVLMPLLVIFSFIAFLIGKRKAKKYAAENNIPHKDIPKMPMIAISVVIAVIIGLLITASVVDNYYLSLTTKKYNKNKAVMSETFSELEKNLSASIPDEYYAAAYKGENSTLGFAALFDINGKSVRCGKLGANLSEYSDLIDTASVYYIIDGKVYIDRYYTQNYQICNSQELINLLENRFADTFVTKDSIAQNGDTKEKYDSAAMKNADDELRLKVETNGRKCHIYLDKDNKMVGYGLREYTLDEYEKLSETEFVFTDGNVEYYKAYAEALINGSATIN